MFATYAEGNWNTLKISEPETVKKLIQINEHIHAVLSALTKLPDSEQIGELHEMIRLASFKSNSMVPEYEQY